jgi:CBS domain-containing protein
MTVSSDATRPLSAAGSFPRGTTDGIITISEALPRPAITDRAHKTATAASFYARRLSWWLKLFNQGAVSLEEIASARHLKARDIMTSPAVTVGVQTPIDVLATLMRRRRVKRVPVLERGRLVGIVSRTDVLDALVRDGEKSR